ncbi:unnamed protein product, partial [Scytosiphon promiscuus]
SCYSSRFSRSRLACHRRSSDGRYSGRRQPESDRHDRPGTRRPNQRNNLQHRVFHTENMSLMQAIKARNATLREKLIENDAEIAAAEAKLVANATGQATLIAGLAQAGPACS